MRELCPICGRELEVETSPNSNLNKKNKNLVYKCYNCGYISGNEIIFPDTLNSGDNIKRIQAIIDELNQKKDKMHTPLTYKEVPLLKELQEYPDTLGIQSEDDINIALEIYRFLSQSYIDMKRVKLALLIDEKILYFDKLLLKYHYKDEYKKKVETDITTLIRNKNIYEDDDCFYLLNELNEFFTEDEIKTILYNAPNHKYTSINYDKIALTSQYLEVIDEVEEILEKSKLVGDELDKLKKEELSKRGVTWHTFKELNN